MFEHSPPSSTEAVLWQRSIKNYRNVERYTYGSGSGTSSVGMDPRNFVTRSLSVGMICMIEDLHNTLCNNMTLLNMEGVDLSTKFNIMLEKD